MITVDKYGASVKIYDGQVNMFFNAAQMKEGWRVISTGGIYMASFYQWLTAPITDFVINGNPITTIDGFTTELAAATPNAGGGGGSVTIYGPYASNAAAIADGRSVGDLYKSTTLINSSPIILLIV